MLTMLTLGFSGGTECRIGVTSDGHTTAHISRPGGPGVNMPTVERAGEIVDELQDGGDCTADTADAIERGIGEMMQVME